MSFSESSLWTDEMGRNKKRSTPSCWDLTYLQRSIDSVQRKSFQIIPWTKWTPLGPLFQRYRDECRFDPCDGGPAVRSPGKIRMVGFRCCFLRKTSSVYTNDVLESRIIFVLEVLCATYLCEFQFDFLCMFALPRGFSFSGRRAKSLNRGPTASCWRRVAANMRIWCSNSWRLKTRRMTRQRIRRLHWFGQGTCAGIVSTMNSVTHKLSTEGSPAWTARGQLRVVRLLGGST